ncbi:unnamed protein product [Paramecium pentaurelia]|uniref:Uncharacterized protein n=1 Tax=Paramecium pentaurelia TaxID=43138 RepID=A0A8S1SRB6_9CILI|nr:unnamed protein product [Paramecium pentaurelia]
MQFSKILKHCFSFETRKINCEKPVILKAFTVWNENLMFSMTPIKATYVEKNNYFAIQKPGWILFELVPVIRQKEGNHHLEWDKKKHYSLGVKQIGQLLVTKNKAYDEASNFLITYQAQANEKKILKINKIAQEIYLSISQEEEQEKQFNPFKITLTQAEYITAFELINFSLPFLLGWDALYTPQYSDNDAQD